jgi:CheY-like chemotaxis protein/DNA-directed RNA polymerase specialized sigma24 family protein
MTLSGAIAHHLPMLRRFARALTGSQNSGDAYVVATLEAMAESGGHIEPDDIRRGLFAALLRVWETVPLNQRTDNDPHPEGIAGAADRSLERMTPRSRVAFLLHSLEGFSIDDIAMIMGIARQDAAGLQETAGREIAGMISTSVLIIEDEPIIAMDLESLVTDLGHRVTEVARTHREALAAMAQNEPGLVLADIHLADGSSGLDAVNEILTEYNLPVIFITAYPERLLTGQRPEPTFLITKPFRPEVVKAIISQALFFDRRAGLNQPLAAAAS